MPPKAAGGCSKANTYIMKTYNKDLSCKKRPGSRVCAHFRGVFLHLNGYVRLWVSRVPHSDAAV